MQGQGQAHVDEAELLRMAQEGNAAALTVLYERFFERIFRLGLFQGGRSAFKSQQSTLRDRGMVLIPTEWGLEPNGSRE